MARHPSPTPPPETRRQRGFEAAASLLKDPLRAVSEKRGFAVARLLTHWAEIAGADLAAVTLPVKVGHTRQGMGATLTLLVAPAHAPMVQLSLPHLTQRINAVYGYSAISRISLTQTAPTGFAEGQSAFSPAPTPLPAPPEITPEIRARAHEASAPVGNPDLRAALETLAQNILTRRKLQEGSQ